MYALGLGVVQNPNGSYYVPGWCSWLPFSSFNDACKLPTEAQIESDNLSNLGPAARSNPVLVSSLKKEWTSTETQQCAEHPDMCAEVRYAQENPTLSAVWGPAAGVAVNRGFESVENAAKDVASSWGMVALAVGVGFFALTALGSGSPRRYGR